MPEDRYAKHGYLVTRRLGGGKPLVALLPGFTTPKQWRFSGGVAVARASLTEATEEAERQLDLMRKGVSKQ
jgi:hypothetical protein